ncbi:MAG: hypothetical protein ACKVOP_09035 [Sphingomonadaceae bacterium]
MDTLLLYAGIALTALAGTTILAMIALRAFRAWIDLKHAELHQRHPGVPTTSQRIDIADLKERIRKLEAIAAGVDI